MSIRFNIIVFSWHSIGLLYLDVSALHPLRIKYVGCWSTKGPVSKIT